MLRFLALGAALSVAGATYASFELALVMQNYSPNGGTPGRAITRWDPVTRVPLGYFLVPGTVDSVVALNSGFAGTMDTFGRVGGNLQIRRYNYGNGVLDSTTNLGVATDSINDAQYVSPTSLLVAGRFSGINAARIYSTAGALTRAFTNPASTNSVLSATQDENGNTYVLSRQAGTTSGDKYTLSSYGTVSGAIANSVVVVDNVSGLSPSMVFADNHLAVNLGYLSSRRVFQVTGTAIGAGFNTGGWFVNTQSFAAGHGDLIHGFAYDSTGTRMVLSTARINTQDEDSYQYITSSLYGSVYDSAIVVAPEPGTMLALGAGIAVLLRRRRR